MLTHLSIRELAVVKSLDMDFNGGLTTITGETGAGKSIAIDALGLCLGERADAGLVRQGAAKAEVSASFDINALPGALAWLSEHDLEDEQECIIRRVISSEGRSKAYVNGSTVSLQQLRALGLRLVSIHGQHAHQQLLKPDVQRQLLDGYAEHTDLLTKVRETYQQLNEAQRRYNCLRDEQQQREDRKQLLCYQVKELDEFALEQGEFLNLETEHKKLSHSQTLLEQAQVSFHQLYEAEEMNALSAVQGSLDRIAELQVHDPELSPIVSLLQEASINIEEASNELRGYVERLEIDPFRMQQIESRYTQALDLARKHQIAPENLYEHHQSLADEYQSLQNEEAQLETLETELGQLRDAYANAALSLSKSRTRAAKKLASDIESEIRQMNMPHAKVHIDIVLDVNASPSAHGLDQVIFKVCTNPGQVADTLDKVVSGGELSRIGLAIQVISSVNNQVPTLIFDEVDTGISGPTAAVVGNLLRRLGNTAQVMCVTHLPQVAASGHQQMFVTKFTDKKTTETHMVSLSESERIEELARLLAGDQLTDSALANARELLNRD